jgi:hypothetical protein
VSRKACPVERGPSHARALILNEFAQDLTCLRHSEIASSLCFSQRQSCPHFARGMSKVRRGMVSPPAWWKSSRAGCDTYIGTPNAYEWQYHIAGQARMGVFGSSEDARTFDFRAGDVGYVPFAMGHYIENTGGETLGFLEPFGSPVFRCLAEPVDGVAAARTGAGPPDARDEASGRSLPKRTARQLPGSTDNSLGGSSLHW